MEYAQEARWTLMGRIRNKLFPTPPRPRKENDPRTYLTIMNYTSVDWLDRLRILWSGRVLIQSVVYTDVEVKEADTVSTFSVLP